MIKYIKFLWSLLRHKWFVLVGGLRCGAPIIQLVLHDWSKFLPSEFIAYSQNFYGGESPNDHKHTNDFDVAWNFHQKRNRHHWQRWVLLNGDEPQINPLPMPERYVREMIADWLGASMAYTGSWNVSKWLNKNGPKMILHQDTINIVNDVLFELGYVLTDNCDWSWANNDGRNKKAGNALPATNRSL